MKRDSYINLTYSDGILCLGTLLHRVYIDDERKQEIQNSRLVMMNRHVAQQHV